MARDQPTGAPIPEIFPSSNPGSSSSQSTRKQPSFSVSRFRRPCYSGPMRSAKVLLPILHTVVCFSRDDRLVPGMPRLRKPLQGATMRHTKTTIGLAIAVAFGTGIAVSPLLHRVIPDAHAAAAPLTPAVIDLAALKYGDIPATPNPELHSK